MFDDYPAMARFLITIIVAFLFLQLAASQAVPDAACQDALNALAKYIASCIPTANNPTILCSGQCATYYQNIFDQCPAEV